MAVFNNASGGTAGTTVTTGNSGGGSGTAFFTVSGAVTFESATPAVGNFYRFSGASGTAQLVTLRDTAAGASFSSDAYVRLNGTPSTTGVLLNIQDDTGANLCRLHIDANRRLTCINQAGAATWTSGTATIPYQMVVGTWYRISLTGTVNATTGTMNVEFHALGSPTVLGSATMVGNTGTADARRFLGGKITSGMTVTGGIDIDEFQFATGTSAKFSDPAAPSNVAPVVSATSSAAHTNIVGYIGDSLTFQDGNGATNIPASLASLGLNTTNLKVNGVVGRSISQNVAPWPTSGTTDIINSWRAGGYHPNYWIFALSSNDFDASIATLQSRVNTVLDLAITEPITKVLWIGPAIQPSPTTYTATQITNIYTALNNVAAARTDLDMEVFDLRNAFNGVDQTGYWTDDRHMSTAGYAARNTFIRSFVDANWGTFNATSGSTVTLTASGTDSDGTINSWLWTKVSGPAATLSSTTVQAPTWVTGAAGTYVWGVTATDDDGATSSQATVSVTVVNANTAPNAGVDQIVSAYASVILTATDAEQTPEWSQTGGTSVGALSGSGATRTFIAPAFRSETVLTFTASDGTLSDSMTVTVRPHSEYAVIGGVEVPMRVIAVAS